MSRMLKAEHVSVKFGEAVVVDDVSFTLEKGQWLMLAGPNGAGKSTLINAVSRGVPYMGSVLLEGRNTAAFRPAELARKIGVLSQQHQTGYAYSVEEIVSLGRYAYSKGLFSGRDSDGKVFIDRALELTGMADMRHKRMNELSGGEIQRAFLAQVFAQNPEILILDEPANHLDLVYQKQIFTLIGEWLAQGDRAVVSVVHDLSLAKRYGTHAVLMQKGRCVAQGKAEEVLNRENLKAVYEMDVFDWMRDMLGQWTM